MSDETKIICPACSAGLALGPSKSYLCESCGIEYPLVAGIPSFLGTTHDASCREHYEEKSADNSESAETVGYLSEAYHHAMISQVTDMVGDSASGARILDVGCGHGGFSSQWVSHSHVVGADFAVGMLQMAQQKGIDAYHADATRLPFEAAQFDLALSIEVIQHLEDAAALIYEMARVVKVGGRVIVSSPNAEALARRAYRLAFRFRPGKSVQDIVKLPRLRSKAQLYAMVSGMPLVLEHIGLLHFPSSLRRTVSRIAFPERLLASNFVLSLRRI